MAPSIDSRTFVGVRNSASGEVSGDTVFHYHEDDGVVWAEYSGGAVVRGHLVGTRTGDELGGDERRAPMAGEENRIGWDTSGRMVPSSNGCFSAAD